MTAAGEGNATQGRVAVICRFYGKKNVHAQSETRTVARLGHVFPPTRVSYFAAAFAAISESSSFGGVGAGPVSEVRRTRSTSTALSAFAAFTTLRVRS